MIWLTGCCALISPAPWGSATSASSTSPSGWAGCTNMPTPAGRSQPPLPARPAAPYTVYGATPQRDSAVVGFLAKTAIVEATQLHLRYDGEIGNGTDNHALNVGVRMTW
jgi:hypothetical protein